MFVVSPLVKRGGRLVVFESFEDGTVDYDLQSAQIQFEDVTSKEARSNIAIMIGCAAFVLITTNTR